ncbi:MAG TPA: LacI family transcriptional regulator [Chloroflexi bacterium]|nr:LacI family transcriptional regulator [Chloroflexota bacterium]
MPVTIKDVAEQVGRSITTVSRALNDYDDVSEETRQLIKQTAREMSYVPSSIAKKLQKQQADMLGIILPTFGPRFSDPFFSEFLAGIGNAATKRGFDLLVSTRAPGDEEIDAYLNKIRSRRVDGFIVVRTRRDDPRIALLLEEKYPFVVFGRVKKNNDFPFVDEDSRAGMRAIINHLIEQGHTRIACITSPQTLTFTHYRSQGVFDAFAEHNLHLDESLIIEGDLTQRSGRRAAKQLLDRPNPPTAIAACNDLMAIGAMGEIQGRGLVVGKDIAVTGFDDIPWAENTHPPLTTVHQPIYRIGSMVCDMLIKLLNGEDVEKKVILQPSLIIRQSSGLANGQMNE